MPVPTNLRRLFVVTLVASAGWFAMGCDDKDAVRVYDAPKDPPSVQAVKPITWTLPAGWQELADDGSIGQFGRVAAIQVSEDPTFALVVSEVQSPELLSNLNRWEGQVGLPPTPAAEAEKKVTPVQVDGHAGHRIDLAGETTDKQTGS